MKLDVNNAGFGKILNATYLLWRNCYPREKCGPSFFEATLAAESDPDAGKEVKLRQIREMVYALPSPDFWIGFHVHEASFKSPPIARMRLALQKWLQTHSQPELRLTVDGWDITFSLLPKSRVTSGNQESGTFSSYEPQWVDPRSAVLKPLEDKCFLQEKSGSCAHCVVPGSSSA